MESLDLDDEPDVLMGPAQRVPDWPTYAVLVLSGLGIVSAAVFRSWVPGLVTYAVLIVFGCGLLYYRRYLAISATQKAGGIGYVSIGGLERAALGALVASCVVNGVFIALGVAGMEWLS